MTPESTSQYLCLNLNFQRFHSFQRGLPTASPSCPRCSFVSPLCLIESIRRQTHLSVIRLLDDSTCQSVTPFQRQKDCRVSFGRIRKKMGRNISETTILMKGMIQLLFLKINSMNYLGIKDWNDFYPGPDQWC